MPPKAAAATGAAAPKSKSKAVKKEKKEEDDENKVPPPDREQLDKDVAAIQEVIDGLQKKQGDLAKKIADRSSGKEEFFAKKGELQGQLQELSSRIDSLMKTKNDLKGKVDEGRQETQKMKNELAGMKKSIGFKSEQEIDSRIKDIEFQLTTTTMQLKQEKDLLKEIAELKKNRPKVGKVNDMESNLANRDFGGDLKAQIQAINEEINVYRDAKKSVQEKFTELMQGRQAQLGDLPKVFEERDALAKEINEKVQERNALRAAFREKEKEYNEWRNEQRAKRQEQYAEERKKQQAEADQRRRMKKVEKLDEQPHIAEMTLIEQTITFCKGLVQSKSDDVKEEKKEIEHNLTGDKKGEALEVCVKKEDREEFWFVPTKAKKQKGKAKGPKSENSTKPIKHNAATFKLFDDLKLDAPITTDDIPATLEKLEAQLEEYKKKVEEWEQNREELKRKILEGGEEAEEEKAPAEEADKTEEKKDEE